MSNVESPAWQYFYSSLSMPKPRKLGCLSDMGNVYAFLFLPKLFAMFPWLLSIRINTKHFLNIMLQFSNNSQIITKAKFR